MQSGIFYIIIPEHFIQHGYFIHLAINIPIDKKRRRNTWCYEIKCQHGISLTSDFHINFCSHIEKFVSKVDCLAVWVVCHSFCVPATVGWTPVVACWRVGRVSASSTRLTAKATPLYIWPPRMDMPRSSSTSYKRELYLTSETLIIALRANRHPFSCWSRLLSFFICLF